MRMGRPLSLVVLGNSLAIMANPRPDRASGVWAEVVADRMSDELGPTALALEARWFELAPQALAEYEQRVTSHAPDVVVIQYGYNEMQPWLLPVWLVRHLLTDHVTTGRVSSWYRRTVVPRLWRALRAYRRPAARVVGTRTWQLRRGRFRRTLQHLVRLSRNQHRALVLVVDVNPVTAKVEHFLPGQSRRHGLYQELIAGVVADAGDPDVRLIRASEVVERLGVETAMPDGIHLSADAHRQVADLVFTEIADWWRQDGRTSA